MANMLTDQQYQQLVARSGGASISSQLILAQSQGHRGDQYLSRAVYADRVVNEPYYEGVSSLAAANAQYPAKVAGLRSDAYLASDAQDIRTQLASDRRSLLPSGSLIDYPSSAYVDRVGSRAISAVPVSSEVVAYPGRYTSSQGPQPLSSAPVANPSDLLARARGAEIAAAYGAGGYVNDVRRLTSSVYDDQELAPRLSNGQGGILGSVPRRGRELERYLLAVQPEKVVRYTADYLAPEPDVKRTVYPTMGNDVYPEDDRYSNYRRAKARRTTSSEFRESSYGPRREREREPYRERRRREPSRDRGKYSPSRRTKSKNDSAFKDENANRVDRPGNSSHSSEGRAQRSGGHNRRNRPSGNSERALNEPSEATAKQENDAKRKAQNEHESDKEGSELGSLCADLSDSEDEKDKKKSEEPATVIDESLAGMIFGCSSATFHECMKLQLFGLPAKNKEEVLRVTPGTKVFLFNFDTKELSGIFEATSHGGWQIDPDAFRNFGGFPSQVQVCCSEQCPNLSLSTFKPAIRENYVNQHKFRFDLNSKQVKELTRLFRKESRARPRHQDNLENPYANVRVQSQDYPTRGILQPRPYSRHAVRWPN